MNEKEDPRELQLPPALQEAVNQMKNTRPVGTIYPWPDMNVGDSVLFEAEEDESIRVLRRRVGVSGIPAVPVSAPSFSQPPLPRGASLSLKGLASGAHSREQIS